MIAAGIAAPNQALCEDQACDLFCLRIGEGERTLKRRTIYARVSHVFKHAEPVRQRFAEEQMSNTRLDKVVGAHAGRACAKCCRAYRLDAIKLDDCLHLAGASPLSQRRKLAVDTALFSQWDRLRRHRHEA
jgi:hypothetical protein